MSSTPAKRVIRGVIRYLDDFNPWRNVRLFGTNIGNDLLAGVTVAVIALPLALAFGVADTLYRVATQLNDYKYLMIRMAQVPMIDMSGAFLLEDIIDKAHANNATVVITGLKPSTDKVLRHLKILEKVGSECCFETFDEAMQWIQAQESA